MALSLGSSVTLGRGPSIMRVGTIFAISLITPLRSPGDSVNTRQRTVTRLSDGIYEIRHKDARDTFPQGNTVVIIGDTGVLVVDSCYLPSSAREDIAQIRQWTDKSVRYLLNTHWHGDHNFGNAAYADAFPGLTIIAHTEAAKLMALRNPTFLSQYPQRAERFQQQLETGKFPSGMPLTEIDRRDLKDAIAGADVVWSEFRDLKRKAPDVTFDHELDLDLGNREVQLKYLGRGNTTGDAIAYLPKERILITGDLVDHPVPYLGGGFPVEQVNTLKKLAELDAETIVPGHGDVLKGKTYLQQEINFLEAVIGAMNQEIGRTNASPQRRFDELKKAVEQNVDLNAWRQKFAGDDPDNKDFFDTFSLQGLLEAAHAELWPR
jgi:cyclase